MPKKPAPFKTLTGATKFVRKHLNEETNAVVSVGVTPIDAFERAILNGRANTDTIFIRWSGGPSYNEVRDYMNELNITLHAGRGPVKLMYTRG